MDRGVALALVQLGGGLAAEPGPGGTPIVGVGLVLWDPRVPGELRAAGGRLPDGWVKAWLRPGQTQAIEQAELLPALLARTTWGDRLSTRLVIQFVDNMGRQTR